MVRDQVVAQDASKESFERRAATIITSASTLSALLFGLVTIATSVGAALHPVTIGLAAGAVIALAVASAFAVRVLSPRDYSRPTAAGLEKALGDWTDKAPFAEQRVALTYLDLYKKQLDQNGEKSRALRRAVVATTIAIVLLGLAVGSTLVVVVIGR